jgi:ABC-type oligopeptide transport system substrate-binding subunit
VRRNSPFTKPQVSIHARRAFKRIYFFQEKIKGNASNFKKNKKKLKKIKKVEKVGSKQLDGIFVS